MTIRDIENHITLQGRVRIKRYNYRTDTFDINEEETSEALKKWGDEKVKYLYSENNELVFELEDEE